MKIFPLPIALSKGALTKKRIFKKRQWSLLLDTERSQVLQEKAIFFPQDRQRNLSNQGSCNIFCCSVADCATLNLLV